MANFIAQIEFKADSFKEAVEIAGQEKMLETNKKFVVRSIEELVPPLFQAEYRPIGSE